MSSDGTHPEICCKSRSNVCTIERMFETMLPPVSPEQRVDDLERRIAGVCGHLNVIHGQLVDLVIETIATNGWHGVGFRSVEHRVSLRTGLSPVRAQQIVQLARRADELPVTMHALRSGRLSIDQAVVVAHTIPTAHYDREACDLAILASVSQLRHALRRYIFAPDPNAPDANDEQSAEPTDPSEASAPIDPPLDANGNPAPDPTVNDDPDPTGPADPDGDPAAAPPSKPVPVPFDPPTGPPPAPDTPYQHPTGEHLNHRWLWFTPPPAAAAPSQPASAPPIPAPSTSPPSPSAPPDETRPPSTAAPPDSAAA